MPSKLPNKYVMTCRVWKRTGRAGRWYCTITLPGGRVITRATQAEHRSSAEQAAMILVEEIFRPRVKGAKEVRLEQLDLALPPPKRGLRAWRRSRCLRGGPQSPRRATLAGMRNH